MWRNTPAGHLLLLVIAFDALVVDLPDRVCVYKFQIQFRADVVVSIDPAGLRADEKLIPEGQIANMGYVGGFYSIERNHLPVMVIGAGAGRVELGGRFRVRPDFNRRFGTGRGG